MGEEGVRRRQHTARGAAAHRLEGRQVAAVVQARAPAGVHRVRQDAETGFITGAQSASGTGGLGPALRKFCEGTRS